MQFQIFRVPNVTKDYSVCYNFSLKTALFLACRMLMGATCFICSSPRSSTTGHSRVYFDYQSSVGATSTARARNEMGETPLHLLATASPSFLHVLVEHFLAQGAELPADMVNYVAKNFQSLDQGRAIATLAYLVENASCRSQTVGGDNALHCVLKHNLSYPDPETVMKVASFLMRNSCDIHAPNSSGETPLQVAVENGHLSVARSVLEQATVPYCVGHTIPYRGDAQGNSPSCLGTFSDPIHGQSELITRRRVRLCKGHQPA